MLSLGQFKLLESVKQDFYEVIGLHNKNTSARNLKSRRQTVRAYN